MRPPTAKRSAQSSNVFSRDLNVASWAQIEVDKAEFAADARGLMEQRVHKSIATLRPDGSPRISGIEARFIDGELSFGSMPNSPKVRDLAADPRFALHSGSHEPDIWAGDSKFAGTVIEVTEPDIKQMYFRRAGEKVWKITSGI